MEVHPTEQPEPVLVVVRLLAMMTSFEAPIVSDWVYGHTPLTDVVPFPHDVGEE